MINKAIPAIAGAAHAHMPLFSCPGNGDSAVLYEGALALQAEITSLDEAANLITGAAFLGKVLSGAKPAAKSRL